MTASSEHSEYHRVRQVCAGFDNSLTIVPLIGNHDVWPYVGHGYNWDPPEWDNYYDEDSADVCIGEYYNDAFGGVYDTLRSTRPLANWQQSPYLQTPTDSSDHIYPSYYNDFAFNYQGCRFITTDFTSRDHAPSGFPGVQGPPILYDDHPYHWTMDWLRDQVKSVPAGERIMVLGHHPYCMSPLWSNFDADQLHILCTLCLRNNRPIVTSIGGHVHPFGDTWGRTTWNGDTICDYYAVNAAKDGNLYIFHMLDSVRLQVTHSWVTPPCRTVRFTANYQFEGGDNVSLENRWDFGDGTGFSYAQDTTSHQYGDVQRDTTYKVSLRVTTESGRHVWVCDSVHVSPIHDVSCVAIDAPADSIPIGIDVTPRARTYNAGLHAENYAVRMRIVNWSDSVVYDTIASVSGHASHDTEVVSFLNWHPAQLGKYMATCSTELATDQVSSNDKLVDTFTVRYPFDASADSITSPLRVGQHQLLVPKGGVSNHYNQQLTFWAKFVIAGSAYADSHQVTMSGLSSQVESFDSIRGLDPGTHIAKLIVRLSGDECPANDTFSVPITVVDSDYWVKLTALNDSSYCVLVEGRSTDSTVYSLQSGSSSCAMYNVPLDQWAFFLPASPLNAHYSADHFGNYIYALGRLGTAPAIVRYDMGLLQWSSARTAPGTGSGQYGGVFARAADTAYVLLRSCTPSFYRYVFSSNTWTSLTNPPLGNTGMAASTYDGNNLIHVLQVQTMGSSQNGLLETYSISTGGWSTNLADTLLALSSGSGIAVATVPGRNSIFALWPSSAGNPSSSSNFHEFNLLTNQWSDRWPYFDSVGPHPSITARAGLVYASCGIPQVTVHTFGRYYPVSLSLCREGVSSDVGPRVTDYALSSSPNPFTRSTTIRWQVPKATHALVAVYDAEGRFVTKLHDGTLEPGHYSREWNSSGMSAGVYLCRFTSSDRCMTQRLILMK